MESFRNISAALEATCKFKDSGQITIYSFWSNLSHRCTFVQDKFRWVGNQRKDKQKFKIHLFGECKLRSKQFICLDIKTQGEFIHMTKRLTFIQKLIKSCYAKGQYMPVIYISLKSGSTLFFLVHSTLNFIRGSVTKE